MILLQLSKLRYSASIAKPILQHPDVFANSLAESSDFVLAGFLFELWRTSQMGGVRKIYSETENASGTKIR